MNRRGPLFRNGRCEVLILSRKPEQSIIIETPAVPVTVMVLDVERDRVKLGISAPESVKVLRSELVS